MTLLNPTLEEIQEKNKERLQELEERTALWHKRRKLFIGKMAIASAVILPLSARMMAFGGSMSWIAYILFFCMGGLLGFIIAKFSIGMLRSMFVYLAGVFPIFLLCFICGWWAMKSNDTGVHILGAGPLLFMVCGWLSWAILGCILGLISNTHDDDTIQM